MRGVNPVSTATTNQTYFFSAPVAASTSATFVYWSSSAFDQVAPARVDRIDWVAAAR